MLWLWLTLWLIRATPNGLGIGFGPVVIAHNYAAEVNAEALAVPEEERAWPLYAEAAIRIRDFDDSHPTADMVRSPESPWWDRTAEFYRQRAEGLAMAREGAQRRHLGYAFDNTDSEWAVMVWSALGVPFLPSQPCDNPRLIDAVLAYVGPLRALTRGLSFDARLAASEGDSDRCTADLRAMLGIARHLRQPPFLDPQLTSMAVVGVMTATVGDIIDRWPASITDQQLAELRNQVTECEPPSPQALWSCERLTLLDLLQRWYTEDGNGNGRITYEGYVDWTWTMAADESDCYRCERDAWGRTKPYAKMEEPPWLTRPITFVGMGSRRELADEWDRRLRVASAEMSDPMWKWTVLPGPGPLVTEMRSGWQSECEYVVLDTTLVTPYGSPAMARERLRQDRDATILAIALEQHRRKHGAYPASLDDLDAELGEIPRDRFDGGPIKYAIRDGEPVLYSVGVDRDDDGGRPPPPGQDASLWRPRPKPEDVGSPEVPLLPDGDWILWPIPD